MPYPRCLPASLLAFALLCSQPPVAHAQGEGDEEEAQEFSVEAFLEIPVLHGPVVSPDGTKVVYKRTQRSVAEDKRTTQLWIAESKREGGRQLTWDDGGASSPAWRPDGALSYLSSRGGSNQVWINPLDGTEPRPITDLEQGVGRYWWSPDGTQLAVIAGPGEDYDPEADDEAEEAAEDAAESADEDAEAEEEEAADPPEGDFTVFDRLEEPDDFPQLWILDVEADGLGEAEPRMLTEPPLYVYHVDWSPDGKTLAMTYNEQFSSLVDEEQRIAFVDVASGERRLFTDPRRHSSMAAYSPDGTQLAYYTDRKAEGRAYLNLKDLVVLDLASGTAAALTGDTQMTLGGYGSTPWYAPVWDERNPGLYLLAAAGTRLDLYRINVPDGLMTAIVKMDGNLGSFHIDGGFLAYTESEQHRPGTLWIHKLGGRGMPRQVDSTDDTVAGYGLVAPQKLALPGADPGVTVEGFLFLPPGADKAGKHPTIIEMHGGPYSRYGNTWTARYPWHLLSHEGFAVFIANPRGGTGYGEEFLTAIYRGFGRKDYADLMKAADALVEQGIADPDRMGFTGYSYGGLMTDVVISRTSRFKAAVSIAGIFNYVSAMGQSNPQLLIDSYAQPWDGDLARLWEDSPASRANQITTPTLVMHGTLDTPVDPRQSIELFSYLQLNGIPSRLVLYEGEGHGINRPVHMVDYETREIQWFRHYLMGDTEAEGAEPPLPVEAPAAGPAPAPPAP